MKPFYTLLLITAAMAFSCHSQVQEKKPAATKKPVIKTMARPAETPTHDTDTIVLGDINSDSVTDSAFVVGPHWISNNDFYGDCKNNSCTINIYFSGGQPSLHFDSAVTASIENIGDIDGDGISEIIAVPGWYIGCYGHINFYTLKKNKWKLCGFAENSICDVDKYKALIKKSDKHTVTVEEYAWDEKVGDQVNRLKTIPIK